MQFTRPVCVVLILLFKFIYNIVFRNLFMNVFYTNLCLKITHRINASPFGEIYLAHNKDDL
jgi:hypothetical protein